MFMNKKLSNIVLELILFLIFINLCNNNLGECCSCRLNKDSESQSGSKDALKKIGKGGGVSIKNIPQSSNTNNNNNSNSKNKKTTNYYSNTNKKGLSPINEENIQYNQNEEEEEENNQNNLEENINKNENENKNTNENNENNLEEENNQEENENENIDENNENKNENEEEEEENNQNNQEENNQNNLEENINKNSQKEEEKENNQNNQEENTNENNENNLKEENNQEENNQEENENGNENENIYENNENEKKKEENISKDNQEEEEEKEEEKKEENKSNQDNKENINKNSHNEEEEEKKEENKSNQDNKENINKNSHNEEWGNEQPNEEEKQEENIDENSQNEYNKEKPAPIPNTEIKIGDKIELEEFGFVAELYSETCVKLYVKGSDKYFGIININNINEFEKNTLKTKDVQMIYIGNGKQCLSFNDLKKYSPEKTDWIIKIISTISHILGLNQQCHFIVFQSNNVLCTYDLYNIYSFEIRSLNLTNCTEFLYAKPVKRNSNEDELQKYYITFFVKNNEEHFGTFYLEDNSKIKLVTNDEYSKSIDEIKKILEQ